MKLRELLERFAWSYDASIADLYIEHNGELKRLSDVQLKADKLVFQIERGIFDADLLLE